MARLGDPPEITFYDTRADAANLKSLSFYLNGFMENQDELRYKFAIKHAIPETLGLTKVQRESLAMGFFRYASNDQQLFFCIDRSDSNYSISAPDLEILSAVDIVFKANHHPQHIRSKISDNSIRDRLVPISHSFPIALSRANRYAFNAVLPTRTDWSIKKVRNRLRYLIRPTEPNLDVFCRKRRLPNDTDVFFVAAYYHQSHHAEVSRFRAEVMLGLKALRGRKIETGLVSDSALPSRWSELHVPRIDISDYFSRLQRSKVAIYVRGPHDGISSKFGQLLALGKPIVGQTLENCRNELMCNPYFGQQFAHHNPESLVAAVDDLLNDAEKMEAWGTSNAAVFDRSLTPRAAVDQMLLEITERLKLHARGKENLLM